MKQVNTLEKQVRHLGRVLGEKYATAYVLKKNGKTYKYIADRLGVTEARVYQLLCLANDEVDYMGKPLSRLEPRYRKALIAAGYTTDADVEQGLSSGKVHYSVKAGIKGLSPKGWKQACDRYKVKPPSRRGFRPAGQKAIKKAIEMLERNGYVVKNREEMRRQAASAPLGVVVPGA